MDEEESETESEYEMENPHQMPPGAYPRLTFKQRWARHGPIALNRWIWGLASLAGLGALIIYALFLSHCVNGEVAGMYLFKLALGEEQVQVAFLGMCVKGKRPGATFNQGVDSVLEMFDTTRDTDLGWLLIAGRDLQTQLPMVFIFPFSVLLLFALWALAMAWILRIVTFPPRGGGPPMLMPRVRHRLEWKTWRIMVFAFGIPSMLICIGSAWSVMTTLQTVVSIWGNLATKLNDPRVAVVQKGDSVETAMWVAAILTLIFGLHTGRMFIETRRLMARNGFLVTNKHSTLDKGPEPNMAMPMPAAFPGTNIPMPPGAVV